MDRWRGLTETITDLLAIASKDHRFEWEPYLPKIRLACNTSVHKSTGFTPFLLMFGQEATLPVNIMYMPNIDVPMSTPEYATQLQDTKQEVQKQLYDDKVHGKPYEVSDMVWLHNPVVPMGTS